jgi:hypothetical protein
MQENRVELSLQENRAHDIRGERRLIQILSQIKIVVTDTAVSI